MITSLLIIAWGTLLAISIGWVTSAVVRTTVNGPSDLPQQVIARTFPGLLDLGIAISAGLAAGYIAPRRSVTSALPGVGIAVALVPPLAAVGITAHVGLGDQSRNALLLYVTNLAAIIFAASLMLLAAGFRPDPELGRRVLRRRIAITFVAVIAVAIPLTLHTQKTVRDTTLRRAVTQAVDEWDNTVRIIELEAKSSGELANVVLLAAGPNTPQPAWELAELIQLRFDGPVDLRLLYERDQLFEVSAR